MARKKKNLESVEVDAEVFTLSIPKHFCLIVQSETEALMFKGFIDHTLTLFGKNDKFGFYRLSPKDDFCYYFHISDEYDQPEMMKFFTPSSFYTGDFVEIESKDLIRRNEYDLTSIQ